MDTVDTHNRMDIVIDIVPLNEQQAEALAVNFLGAKKLCTLTPSPPYPELEVPLEMGVQLHFFFFFGLKTPYVAHSKCSVIFQCMN